MDGNGGRAYGLKQGEGEARWWLGGLATVKTTGPTGVEMEALTAVSVAALTVYDMVKAVDRGLRIEAIHLVSKSGGASGDYAAESSR